MSTVRMTLRELAAHLGCECKGDGNIVITGVAAMEQASPSELTFLANPKYAPKVKHSRAAAILVSEPLSEPSPASLVSSNPYHDFARALALFYQPPRPKPGIHPQASIAPSARIAEGGSIGAFAVVGENVSIGRNAVLHPHVVIYDGAQIGDDFYAHSHAVVREFCRIGNRVILQNGVVVGGDGFGFAKTAEGTHFKIVQSGVTVIEDDVEIQSLTSVDRATVGETRVKRGAKIDSLVQVGHGCVVGEDNIICAQTGLAGSSILEKNVLLAGQVGVSGHLTIHDNVVVYAQSGVGGFSNPVSLTSSGWPPGASGTFNPTSVTPTAGGATSKLFVTTSGASQGTTTITVTGTSGSTNHSTTTSLTVSTAAQVLSAFISCVGPNSTAAVCTLPTLPSGSYYDVNQTIAVGHSNVTVTGGGSPRQTVLVRDPSLTGDMMRVDSNTPLTGITIENFLFCGNNNTLTRPTTPTDPCPPPVSTACGSNLLNNGQTCVDLGVYSAALPNQPTAPFNFTGPYAVEIANVDMEDSTGDAIALYGNGPGNPNRLKSVNDIYIHNSVINSSAVTGILIGANSSTTPGENYGDAKVCDGDGNWPNDPNVYIPRDIRIENSNFANNNTGAIGAIARWVGVRNNNSVNNTPWAPWGNNPAGFYNNYINPQAGNQHEAGGDIFFDQCSDTVQISGNTLTGPSVSELLGNPSQNVDVHSMELWARNITVSGNNLSNYPFEGIYLISTYNATVQGNTLTNNDTIYSTNRNNTLYYTGGISVWTSDPGGPCSQIPRDTQSVTITGNTSDGSNQAYGVRIGDRGVSRNNIDNLTIASNNTLEPVALDAIEIDNPIVTLSGYSGATPTMGSSTAATPRALATDVGTSLQKCLSPGATHATFTFEGMEAAGSGKIQAINVIISSAGPAAPMCHFEYVHNTINAQGQVVPVDLLYLDDQTGADNWVGHSVVGPGGTTLTNNQTCTIYAGTPYTPPGSQPDPPSCAGASTPTCAAAATPNVYPLKVDVVFLMPFSNPAYMYTMVENTAGYWSVSGGGPGELITHNPPPTWSYWGTWYIP